MRFKNVSIAELKTLIVTDKNFKKLSLIKSIFSVFFQQVLTKGFFTGKAESVCCGFDETEEEDGNIIAIAAGMTLCFSGEMF